MSQQVHEKSLLEQFIDEIKEMRQEGRKTQDIHIWEDSTSDFELLEIIIPAIENQMGVTIEGGNVGMQYHLTITLD